MPDNKHYKKRLLLIYPYQRIYPPVNGGMQRSFHLIIQLAKVYDVSVLIGQSAESFNLASAEFPSLENVDVIPQSDITLSGNSFLILFKRIWNALQFRWFKRDLFASTDTIFLEYYLRLRQLLRKDSFDAILINNFSLIDLSALIRKLNPHAHIIYDAFNVDSALALIQYRKKYISEKHYRLIYHYESNLFNYIDGLMVCSQLDRNTFESMNKSDLFVSIIPNGVTLSPVLFDKGVKSDSPSKIIFCGSLDYFPNIEGLLWFYDMVLPIVKRNYQSVKLVIIGSGSPDPLLSRIRNDSSVEFLGYVDDVRLHYNEAALAIVPLLSGSGTRLKIFEAMSLGVPVVSTPMGAEGIECSGRDNILLSESPEVFAGQILDLLHNKALRIQLQQSARRLISEKYNWDIIGHACEDFIEACLTKPL